MRIVWVIAIYTVYGRKLIDDNMTKQITQERRAEILNTAKEYWSYIIATFQPDTKHRADIMPNITIKRAKRWHGYTLWDEPENMAGMNITTHTITLWLNSHKLNDELKLVLIHELIHARGYNHGIIKGLKFYSHSGDKLSAVVLKGIKILEADKTLNEIELNYNGLTYKQGKKIPEWRNFSNSQIAYSSGLVGKRKTIIIKR